MYAHEGVVSSKMCELQSELWLWLCRWISCCSHKCCDEQGSRGGECCFLGAGWEFCQRRQPRAGAATTCPVPNKDHSLTGHLSWLCGDQALLPSGGDTK